MKPGTKSRKLGLQIPTVNPCNDFIVDYLIRNKIKSDKQVLCKSYLYNLAIEAVRKYPLPLICEEQLAALEGFGNFFIGQVGRLIKKHYNRGRLPTEKEMQEDDEAHFEALRAKKKPDENPLGKIYSNLERDLDSPGFGSSRPTQVKRKYYRPKKNTEPFHILQALIKLNANKHAVTKGDINQVLFEEGKEKIRLWYVLRQKLQEFDFINLDPKNEEYFYLTEKGLNYVTNYEKQQQSRTKGRKKSKKSDQDSQSSQQHKDKARSSVSQKQTELSDSEEDEKSSFDKQKKTKATSKQSEGSKPSKIVSQMRIKKNAFARNTKFESVELLINQKSSDLSKKQKIMESSEDLNYQFCEINLADFLWSTQGKILDYMAIRIKQDQFDEEVFKTICFRGKMTSCENFYIIMEKSSAQLKVQQEKQPEEGLPTSQTNHDLICSAIVSRIKIVRTRNLEETMKFAENMTGLILQKISKQGLVEKGKKSGKSKSINEENEQESIKYLGTLQTFNKKVSYPYEMATIMGQILKCIPQLSEKSIKVLMEKYPTLAIMHKKTQDAGSTKDKKNLLSYFLNEKVSQSSLNTLVQLLFYQAY